jgi:hypothetical protein
MLATLARIDAWDPVNAAAVTLYAASHDDPRLCHIAGQGVTPPATWWPALAKLPALRYDLFDGAFTAAITSPSSELTLQVEPWPDFGRYILADARIQLWAGNLGDKFSDFTQCFDGRITSQPETADGQSTVSFSTNDAWLDAALLTSYAGTTGIEGGADLKGQPKPLSLGAPRYVAGQLIDTVNSVFQVSGYGRIVAFEAALEKLARYPSPLADYATYDALVAATIPAGRWATCLTYGLARFGAPPAGQICFLVQGDNVAGTTHTAGQLIRRLAQLAGGGDRLDTASLAALDTARPYPLSIYLDAQTTARDLIQKIAASVNAVAGVSWLGKLFVVPIALATPSTIYAADGSALPPVSAVKQVANDAPWKRLTIGAARCWTVHALADIAFTATLVDHGGYVDGTTYREGDIVELVDGTRWLHTGTDPTTGVAPTDGSSVWTQLPDAASPSWESISDPNNTKPEDNATLGATVGVDLKTPSGLIVFPEDIINPVIDLTPEGELGSRGPDGIREVLGRVSLSGAVADAIAAGQLADGDGQRAIQDAASDLQDEALAAILRGDEASRAAQAADASTREEITTRIVDGESATIRRELVTTARLGRAEASVVEATMAAVTREQAIAQALKVLSTSFDQNVALVAQQLLSLSNAQGGIASDVSGVAVTMAMQGQSIDDANAQALRALLAGDQATLASYANIAAARQEITARLVAGEVAQATARLALLAKLNGNTASLEELRQTTVTQLASLTLVQSKLRADFNGNASSVNDQLIALAGADRTISGRVDDFESDYNGNKSQVSSQLVSLSKADQTLSGRLDDFSSEYADNKGLVQHTLTTLSDAQGSQSQDITKLKTSVGDQTTTLTEYGQSIDGLGAKWGAEIDNNGNVTGFALANGDGRTDAGFVVDRFKIVQPNGGNPRTVFAIGDDGNVYILTKLLANSVEANNLKLNSAITPALWTLDNAVTGTGFDDTSGGAVGTGAGGSSSGSGGSTGGGGSVGKGGTAQP